MKFVRLLMLLNSIHNEILTLNAANVIYADPFALNSSGNVSLADDYIQSLGFKSTINVDFLLGDGRLDADGAFSAEKSTIEADEVFCNGDSSCANSFSEWKKTSSKDMLSSTDWSQCGGANSCENSYQTAATWLHCDGEQSCANTLLLENSRQIYGHGHLSLYNTTTKAGTDINYASWSMVGYYAGYLLDIQCLSSDDVCYINCYGNGCYNTRVNCHSSAMYGRL